MRQYSRDELLALTPEHYLADGFLDAAGALRRELIGDAATAAATQLVAAGLSPQELAFTYEALRILLPRHAEGDARARIEAALGEALATVARMIRQPNNEGLVSWSRSCAAFVRRDAEIPAFLTHIQAVLRLHALIVNLPPPDAAEPDGSSPAPSSSGPA
jgi:hypothetical protein